MPDVIERRGFGTIHRLVYGPNVVLTPMEINQERELVLQDSDPLGIPFKTGTIAMYLNASIGIEGIRHLIEEDE